MLTGILGSALALERDEMYACGAPLLYFTDAAALELTETCPIGETYQITIFVSIWHHIIAFQVGQMHFQTQKSTNRRKDIDMPMYVCIYGCLRARLRACVRALLRACVCLRGACLCELTFETFYKELSLKTNRFLV